VNTGNAAGLELVVKLARQNEQGAATRLQQAQAWLAQSQNRLEAIQGYLREYRTRSRSRSTLGVLVRDLHDQRRFLTQLEQTLAAQIRVLEQQQRAADLARAEWVALRKRREALETLLEQREQREAGRRERIEQQRLDDRPWQPVSAGGFFH
jgi:flagellar protein FliJ